MGSGLVLDDVSKKINESLTNAFYLMDPIVEIDFHRNFL